MHFKREESMRRFSKGIMAMTDHIRPHSAEISHVTNRDMRDHAGMGSAVQSTLGGWRRLPGPQGPVRPVFVSCLVAC